MYMFKDNHVGALEARTSLYWAISKSFYGRSEVPMLTGDALTQLTSVTYHCDPARPLFDQACILQQKIIYGRKYNAKRA